MLITLSGVVGSGKSTAARYVLEILKAANVPHAYFRFHTVALPSRRRKVSRSGVNTLRMAPIRELNRIAIRRRGYRRRSLTSGLALVYVARALMFRARLFLLGTGTCVVVNRYFYDSLAHYRLTTVTERMWLSLLRLVMPAPHLPVLLVASEEVLIRRRPNYAREYFTEMAVGYRTVQQHCSEVTVIRGDRRRGMEIHLAKSLVGLLGTQVMKKSSTVDRSSYERNVK